MLCINAGQAVRYDIRSFSQTKKRQNPGDDLLSHCVVSSALQGLTTVFGMGTGVAPALESPGFCLFFYRNIRQFNNP